MSTTRETAIAVDGVSKQFRLYHERNQSIKAAVLRGGRARYDEFWALKDVSFDIPRGSTFGLVGENGSGKSTLLKCIARILQPDAGRITRTGSVAALLELGSGFHPELSGRENVYLNGSILGMKRSEIDAKFDAIVDFAGIKTFIDQPVKNYSSGMYVRLGFSVAINVDPDILLVDEVLAVGDANFQDKCMEKFAAFRRVGKTVVVVSHAMGSMRTLCDEAVWLDHGTVQAAGAAATIVDDYVDAGHLDLVTTDAGATRWGSGEARIVAIEALDREGVPRDRFRTGEPLTLRLRYEAHEPIERPVFGYALENLDGVYVWAHNSFDAGVSADRIEGSGHIDLRMDALMLQPGSFDVLASIVDHTMTHTFDFLRPAVRFEVEHGEPRESGGIVALGGRWGTLEPDAASGEHPTTAVRTAAGTPQSESTAQRKATTQP